MKKLSRVAPFARVPMGRLFLCRNGGRWRKVGEHTARCAEDDSAFKRGDCAAFMTREFVQVFSAVA